MDKELTLKEQAFVKEYLIDFNGARAARDAGYDDKQPRSRACKLIAKDNIQKALSKAIEKRFNKCDISAEYILTKIKEIADNTNEETRDRLKALDMLGKYLKLWVDGDINRITRVVNITINKSITEGLKKVN